MALSKTVSKVLGRRTVKATGVNMNWGRRGLSTAPQRPARDTSAPTTATLKMDLTSIYFPHENCWIPGENKVFCPKLVLLFFSFMGSWLAGPQMLVNLKAIWLLPSLPLWDGITFSFLFFGIIKTQTFLVSDAFLFLFLLYSVSSLGLRHALCI